MTSDPLSLCGGAVICKTPFGLFCLTDETLGIGNTLNRLSLWTPTDLSVITRTNDKAFWKGICAFVF